jgi:hypothetical protein
MIKQHHSSILQFSAFSADRRQCIPLRSDRFYILKTVESMVVLNNKDYGTYTYIIAPASYTYRWIHSVLAAVQRRIVLMGG